MIEQWRTTQREYDTDTPFDWRGSEPPIRHPVSYLNSNRRCGWVSDRTVVLSAGGSGEGVDLDRFPSMDWWYGWDCKGKHWIHADMICPSRTRYNDSHHAEECTSRRNPPRIYICRYLLNRNNCVSHMKHRRRQLPVKFDSASNFLYVQSGTHSVHWMSNVNCSWPISRS